MTPSLLFITLWGLGLLPLLLTPWFPQTTTFAIGFDALLLLALWLDIRQTRHLPPPKITRICPPSFSQDHPTSITFELQNPSTQPLQIWLFDSPPDSFETPKTPLSCTLKPREKKLLSYPTTPTQRGHEQFGETFFRFSSHMGLFLKQTHASNPQTVAVYPNLAALKKVALLARSQKKTQLGIRRERRRGKGTEFESLREYTPDDEYRNINWKSTAKRQHPITQTYQDERSQNILIVLDIGRTMRGMIGTKTRLDLAIEASLTLSQIAQQSGDRVGLLLFSHRLLKFIPPNTGKRHSQQILNALTPLTPLDYDIQYHELFRFLSTKVRKRSLLVFFTDLGDEEAAQQLKRHLPLLKPTHLPLCISLADPTLAQKASAPITNPNTLFRRTAALELLQERQLLLANLRQHGVLFLDCPPQELSNDTINQYLKIKAQHLL